MPLRKDDPKSVGGYKLLDRLGAGGMGVVYRGRSRSGREVAVKVVHAQYAEDPVFRTRFRQEIEAVRKVSGAFTAPVVDADPEADRPWMATQYVAGRSLADRIRDRGALRDGELRQLALGLAEALRDIHRAGVVHRDLKPANVLMAEDGPRVIDFGISRAAENHNTLTETGQMIGTPPFMSPEQLTDARTVGPASDVFSLGALLVYATTGRGPFDTDSPYLTAYRVVHHEPVLDGIGQPLRGILERCLSKQAADRPGLDELAQEFAAALPEAEADSGGLPTVTLRGDDPVVTRTRPGTVADPDSTTWSGRRRRRIRPLLAAAGTVGALALGLLWYVRFGPGFEDGSRTASPAPTATSRWTTPPGDWRPWQTTLFETAPLGAQRALGADNSVAGEPACLVSGDGAYCAGDGILPVRLDARTGKTLWRADIGPAGDEMGSYTTSLLGVRSGTVVMRQGFLPVSGEADLTEVVGLDAETGEQLWKHRVNDENLEMALSGGLVITSADSSTVTARSPRTGTARWSAQMPEGHYCTFLAGGTDVYAQCHSTGETTENSVLLVLDPADGSARTLKIPYESGILGVLDGRLVMLQAPSQKGTSGEVLPYDRALLVDPDTGARTTVRLAKGFDGEASLSGGTLWFVSSGGVVTAVSPLTGEQLWQTRTSLEQPGAATYDTRSRTLYVASISGRVAALDGRKGTSLWETLPRTGASGGTAGPRVLLYEGSVIVATSDSTVFALDPADPADPEREPVSG